MWKLCVASTVVALSALSQQAFGSIALPTDAWVPFEWGEAPHDPNDQDPLSFAFLILQVNNLPMAFEGPFTYSSNSPLRLTVTDVFEDGDQFLIFLDGEQLGTTSVPKDDGKDIGADFEAALLDPDWSSGVFLLPSGSHEIAIKTIEIPDVPFSLESGQGFLRASTFASVPEATTMAVWVIFALAFVVFSMGRTHSCPALPKCH